MEEYDKKNKVINTLKEGKGIITDYYKNVNKKFQCEYINGEINNKVTEFYNNGILKYEVDFLNGKIKIYDKNGELKIEADYKNEIMWNLKVNENLDNSNDNINVEFKQGEEIIKDEDIKLDLDLKENI